MPRKELVNISVFSSELKLPNAEVLDDIAVEKEQNVFEIYRKNMAMAGDGNQKEERDLKIQRKCELNTIVSEKKKKWKDLDFNTSISNDLPPHSDILTSSQSLSTKSSLSSESSFVFLEPESSVQECKYNNLKEESNASFNDWQAAESEKKILLGDSVESFNSFFTDPESKNCSSHQYIPSVSKFAENRKTVYTSVHENGFIAGARKHLDVNNKQIDRSEDSIQKCEETGEEDLLKELREAFENSTNCLLSYLEKLPKIPLKQEKTNPDEENWISKRDRNKSKRKLKDNSRMTMGVIGKTSNSSVATSNTLKNNSNTSVKQNSSTETCMIPPGSSKGIQIEPLTNDNCDCDCCKGRCLHLQRTRKIASGNQVKKAKRPKKKMTSNVLRKEIHSVTNESKEIISNSSSLVHKPNAANILEFKWDTAIRRKSNVIEVVQNADNNPKIDKIVGNHATNDEQENCEAILEDSKINFSPLEIFFCTSIFVLWFFICLLFLSLFFD